MLCHSGVAVICSYDLLAISQLIGCTRRIVVASRRVLVLAALTCEVESEAHKQQDDKQHVRPDGVPSA